MLNSGERVRTATNLPFQLQSGDTAHAIVAHIEYSVSPAHEVTVFCDQLDDAALRFHWSNSLRIFSDIVDIAADVIVQESRYSSEPGESYLRLKPSPQKIEIGRTDRAIDDIHFGLLNFPLIFQENPVRDRSPEFALSFGEWQVSLWEAPEARDARGAPTIPKGFLISHVGRIRRQDNAQFSVDEMVPTLEALQWTFSFISGRVTGTVHDTAHTNGNSWQSFSAKIADPYKFVLGAGLRGTDASVAQMVERFLGRSTDEWKALAAIIYWYCKSNLQAVGADGSLVLAQTGLEKLSWHVLVDINEIYSARAFDRLNTGEKMRALVNHCLGTSEIPEELANLAAFSNDNDRCSDGPSAINQIRNEIIHPRRRFEGRLPIAEAWQLALSYLELCLLHHIGYNGTYLNRLRADRAKQSVPWA